MICFGQTVDSHYLKALQTCTVLTRNLFDTVYLLLFIVICHVDILFRLSSLRVFKDNKLFLLSGDIISVFKLHVHCCKSLLNTGQIKLFLLKAAFEDILNLALVVQRCNNYYYPLQGDFAQYCFSLFAVAT